MVDPAPLTPADLDALDALAAAATPGPWWKVDIGDDDGDACVMSKHTAVTDGCAGGEVSRRDAALIVAAVNALPRLTAAVREARAEAERMREELADCQGARDDEKERADEAAPPEARGLLLFGQRKGPAWERSRVALAGAVERCNAREEPEPLTAVAIMACAREAVGS